MPFTPAHIAAVLPAHRLWPDALPLAPLAIGSIAPDVEYFLRQAMVSTIGHTLPGLVVFCLPLGLVALWLFERVLRPALLGFAPEEDLGALQGSGPPSSFGGARALTRCGALIVLGALTHIAWDACTHADGWVVLRVPALEAVVASALGRDVRLFKVLQHASTLVGLAVVGGHCAAAYFRATGRSIASVPGRWTRRQVATLGVLAALAVLSGSVAGLLAMPGLAGPEAVAAFVVRGSVGAQTGLLLGLVGVWLAPARR